MATPIFDEFVTKAFVTPMRQHLDEQFPKTCNMCGHAFSDFDNYVNYTTAIKTPICYDDGELALSDLVGTVSMANCRCGTTLALECHGEMYEQFVGALCADAQRYSITNSEVLALMRDAIRTRA